MLSKCLWFLFILIEEKKDEEELAKSGVPKVAVAKGENTRNWPNAGNNCLAM